MPAASAPADVFPAVADPTRRAILESLAAGERSARELGAPFRISQPAVSQHLRILRAARLVRVRREGRRRVYRLNPAPLAVVSEWASTLADLSGHVWAIRPTAAPAAARGQRAVDRDAPT